MYLYTLGFIKRNNEILMINREKKPWKGAWNGVGGKLEINETPKECILREIKEETRIDVSFDQIIDKGILSWEGFDALGQGLYLFLIEVDSNLSYQTPYKTNEGILDWKTIDWINDFQNEGVAKNIPHFLLSMLEKQGRYHYHCSFENNQLKSVTSTLLIDRL